MFSSGELLVLVGGTDNPAHAHSLHIIQNGREIAGPVVPTNELIQLTLVGGAVAHLHRPDVQIVVSGAPHVPDRFYAPASGYTVVDDSVRVLMASTAVLTKSGTTTVQASLTGTPLVIAYRVHPLSYLLARRLVRVDSIGMVNLLAGERIAPEFVQHLHSDEIADALEPLLDPDSSERKAMIESLHTVRGMLGEPGAPERVARMAAELLDGKV